MGQDDPIDLRGFLTVGKPRMMREFTILLTATPKTNKFFVQIVSTSRSGKVRKHHRNRKIIDKMPPGRVD